MDCYNWDIIHQNYAIWMLTRFRLLFLSDSEPRLLTSAPSIPAPSTLPPPHKALAGQDGGSSGQEVGISLEVQQPKGEKKRESGNILKVNQ